MDKRQVIQNRLDRLETRLHVGDRFNVDWNTHWAASVRFSHQEEDLAEACRLAGLTQPVPGIVFVGEIPSSQVPPDFVPSIRPARFHAPWELSDAVA